MLKYLVALSMLCSATQLLCAEKPKIKLTVYNATDNTLYLRQPRGGKFEIPPKTEKLNLTTKFHNQTTKIGSWVYGFGGNHKEFTNELTLNKKHPVIIIEAEDNNPLALKDAYAIEYDEWKKLYGPEEIIPQAPLAPRPNTEVSAPAGAGSTITQTFSGSDKGDAKSSESTYH